MGCSPLGEKIIVKQGYWTMCIKFVTIRFDVDHDLDLNFQGQIWNSLYLIQKMLQLPRNGKQTYHLNSRPQWQSSLTLAGKVGCKDLLDSDRDDFRCQRAIDWSGWNYWQSPLPAVSVVQGDCESVYPPDPVGFEQCLDSFTVPLHSPNGRQAVACR